MKDSNSVNESSQVPEQTIKAMFQTIWTGLGDALAALPRWEKGFLGQGLFSVSIHFHAVISDLNNANNQTFNQKCAGPT